MAVGELIFGCILVLALLGLAIYFGMRQKHSLRLLRSQEDLSPDDRQYLRSQIRRRLFCSILMVVLAGQLGGGFILDLRLGKLKPNEAAQDNAPDPEQREQAKEAIRLFAIYWIAALVVLLALLSLAAIDFVAIARHGLTKQRQLEAAKRAMLEDEAARFRRGRNGNQN